MAFEASRLRSLWKWSKRSRKKALGHFSIYKLVRRGSIREVETEWPWMKEESKSVWSRNQKKKYFKKEAWSYVPNPAD